MKRNLIKLDSFSLLFKLISGVVIVQSLIEIHRREYISANMTKQQTTTIIITNYLK